MAIITNAEVILVHAGEERALAGDCWGNNAAVECPACKGYPVLMTARPGWRGSREDRPAECRKCNARVWMLSRVAPRVRVRLVKVDFRAQDG